MKTYSVMDISRNGLALIVYTTNKLWKAQNLVARTNEDTIKKLGKLGSLYIFDNVNGGYV